MGKMYKYIRKFSDYEKREIVRRYAAGEPLKTIATDFHTSPAVVSEIGITAGVPKRKQGPQMQGCKNGRVSNPR
jgi:hypothetical protein